MSFADAIRGSYERQIAKGTTVVLRRVTGATLATVAEVSARARVTDYDPQEIVGDVQQGDRRVIMLASDVAAFPLPIQANGSDRIVIGGKVATIRTVDDQTRRVAGDLVAYELRVRGA